ncbi:MAG: helix-turn-helix domain-containing protein [Chloroflexota bacterium]|nr:helix-turn-helix domain-containing protein [Chloroflexota bacterium]
MPTATKIILMALADHADDDGVCWPGMKGVAAKCGIHHRNAQRHVSKLISLGLIQSIPRHRPDRSRTSNFFILSMSPEGVTIDMGVVTELAPPHGTSAMAPTAPAPSPHGASATPRTVIEPSLEPSEDLMHGIPSFLAELRRINVWTKVSGKEEAELSDWLRETGVGARAALRAATALAAKWDGRKWKDPLATFKNWALREGEGVTSTRKEVKRGEPGEHPAPDSGSEFDFGGLRDTGIDRQ